MIYFYDEKNDINTQVENVLEELNNELAAQKQQLKILLECLNKLNSIIQDTDDIAHPKQLTNLLKDIKTNLDYTRNNISNIKKLINYVSDKEENNNLTILPEKYNELAALYKEVICKTLDNYNDCIFKYINNIAYFIGNPTPTEQKVAPKTSFSKEVSVQVPSKNSDNQSSTKSKKNMKQHKNEFVEDPLISEVKESTQKPKDVQNESNNIKDNNVLLISETQRKIFLPYSVENLNSILDKNNTKYANLNDIIENEYIVPIDKYKNSTISRFKEAYNLMRKKERSSVKNSLELALELAFNNSLNPAIITACNNLNELDTYLDCLTSNELDKFKIFEIKYEALPTK